MTKGQVRGKSPEIRDFLVENSGFIVRILAKLLFGQLYKFATVSMVMVSPPGEERSFDVVSTRTMKSTIKISQPEHGIFPGIGWSG